MTPMDTDEQPAGWSAGERAGALLLLLVACGLAAIAGDILFSGRWLTRGCCDDGAGAAG